MNITIIALGHLKEEYLRTACAEYEKRMSAFGRLGIIELSPERLPDEPSQGEIETALLREAAQIKAKIPVGSFVAALCIEGKQMTSEVLAEKINAIGNSGKSSICLIIGSSYGLAPEIKRDADIRLSMSEMTFPHQLARVMLLEQIYRAFTIINNRRYHK